MLFAIILTVLVGASIVIQNAANAHFMRGANLWILLFVGNMLAACICIAAFFVQRTRLSFVQELARVPIHILIPGVCGVVITAGMPFAIGRIGVFNTLSLAIGCQILASLAWDQFFADSPASLPQLLGALLVFAGVVLILRPTN